jgi:hypothetical protein
VEKVSGPTKPRHTAALALVVWYLMVPLSDYSNWLDPQPHLYRLSELRLLGGFNSAAACRAQIEKMVDRYKDPNHRESRPWTDWNYAQCIASDDPRLSRQNWSAHLNWDSSKDK